MLGNARILLDSSYSRISAFLKHPAGAALVGAIGGSIVTDLLGKNETTQNLGEATRRNETLQSELNQLDNAYKELSNKNGELRDELRDANKVRVTLSECRYALETSNWIRNHSWCFYKPSFPEIKTTEVSDTELDKQQLTA